MDKYDSLKLENQLCFPLYAAAREISRRYYPYLSALDLTYTQYIVMMVMWEQKEINVKDLGGKLCLDSGTLTPLLKNLEKKGLIKRSRSTSDERVLLVRLTDDGLALREKAVEIPPKMAGCVRLSKDDAATLYRILYQIIGNGGEEK